MHLVKVGEDDKLNSPINEGSSMDYQAVEPHVCGGNDGNVDGDLRGRDAGILSDDTENEAHIVLFADPSTTSDQTTMRYP
jgi:hypothetical protein